MTKEDEIRIAAEGDLIRISVDDQTYTPVAT